MSDAGELTSKLWGGFSAAKERVRAMQQAAEDRRRRLLEGYQQFMRSAQQVKDLLRPRVEAFESFFKGARKSISRLDLGPGGNEYRGTFVTFDFPGAARSRSRALEPAAQRGGVWALRWPGRFKSDSMNSTPSVWGSTSTLSTRP
jgi:hypothetical protein